MKSFFKYLLATILGVFIASFLIFIIFIGIIGVIISSSEKEVTIKPNSILSIDLSKQIPDRSSLNPLDNFDFVNFKVNPLLGLNDILKCIKQAKTDPNIKGIYFNPGIIQTGFGSLEEIHNALLDFKTSKKFIISYANIYTHGSYYLASVADSIFLNPQGDLMFIGLRSEIVFYKGLFEKLGIEPEVIRHGKFKSFVEQYTNDRMSDANRFQITELISSLWNHMIEGISDERHISVKDLNRLADGLVVRNAKTAFDNKLVDGLRYKDQVINCLTKLSGVSSEKKLEFVTLAKYNKAFKSKYDFQVNKIALIYASGEIIMGNGDESHIGSENLSQAISQARKDSTVKAIVLRVNSPGGISLASDIIWRELYLAKKTKPLIISMGSVAASGGYYISVPADTIVADATTITGSIGVFAIIFNAKTFFNNKLGITDDIVKSNKHSDLGSLERGFNFRALTGEEKGILQVEVENTYNTFLTRVSEGRKMSIAAVDSVGQGHVWSALDAKKIGLVDVIGGLDTAFAIAAKKAHLKNYRIEELPKVEDKITEIFNGFSSKIRQNLIKSTFGNNRGIYYDIDKLIQNQGIQNRIPYDIDIY